MVIYTTPALVRRTILSGSFSRRTVPWPPHHSPAAGGGGEGSYSREAQDISSSGSPGGLVDMRISRAKIAGIGNGVLFY